MTIWQMEPDLEAINATAAGTLSEQLGIEFIESGDDFLRARMPVDRRTRQPLGMLHGGASAALAETLGSVAGLFAVDPAEQFVVGLALNANHIRPVREGWVYGLAKPYHLGRTTQVWGIEVSDEQGRIVSIVRLTLAVQSYPDEGGFRFAGETGENG
ncbi:MAG: hotdog fold thioesterase [Anaerolineales bacterium]